MGKAKNPAYEGLIKPADPDKDAACPNCWSKLVSPDNCSKCRGANAMTTFCPQCDMDCGCEEWQ